MKALTRKPLGSVQVTPTTTSDYKTVALPAGTSMVLISVQTTDARISFDGTNPDATHGSYFPKSLAPVLVPIGSTTVPLCASTASANAVCNFDCFQ